MQSVCNPIPANLHHISRGTQLLIKTVFIGLSFWEFLDSNLPLPHQKYMQFQYRPWCPSLKGIRASTELFINNIFLWWLPHFSAFGLPNYNTQKRYIQFQWLPSHLSQLPNLTLLLPFPPSQPHYSPTFPTFPNSPPLHLQLKHSKIITLELLSPHWFLREGSQYQNWKAKSLFSPPGRRSQTTGFEIWFARYYTTEICSVWVT